MIRRLVTAAVGSLFFMLASTANAVPFTGGSFAFVSFTSSVSDVTTTTIFPLTGPVVPGSPVDDFTLVALPAVLTLPAGAINFNLIGCCNWSDPLLGSFIGTVAPVQLQTTPHPNASATWDVVGTFTVGAGWDNAGDVLTANMTFALTQTGGPNEATSISGTFHSPRFVQVPEPASLALIGLGLVGFGVARRRKPD